MIYETVGIRFWLFVRNIHSKFYSFKIQRKIFIQRNYSFKILAQNIHSMFYSLKSGNIYSKLSKTKSAQIELIEMLGIIILAPLVSDLGPYYYIKFLKTFVYYVRIFFIADCVWWNSQILILNERIYVLSAFIQFSYE